MNSYYEISNVSVGHYSGRLFGESCYLIKRLILLIVTGLLICPLTAFATPNQEKKVDQMIAISIGKMMVHQLIGTQKIHLLPDTARFAGSYFEEPAFFLTTVVTYQREPTQNGFQLNGKVVHRDTLMRSVVTNFKATGVRHVSVIEIDGLSLTPAYSPAPRVAFYYIPDDGRTLQKLDGMPFKKALQTAQKTARRLNGKYRADQSPQNYIIALFVMEPRQETEKLVLTVPERAVIPGSEGKGAYKSEGGWHALFAPVRLAFNGGEELFFSVSISAPNKGTQPLLTYSSYSLTKRLQIALKEKGYNIGTADGLFGKNTRNAIIDYQKDHKLEVDGKISLPLLKLVKGPKFKNGIKLAQARLASINYSPGGIDGKMGGKTREALRSFQKDFMLQPSGSLNAETLAMLLVATNPKPSMSTTLTKENRFEDKMWPNLKTVR